MSIQNPQHQQQRTPPPSTNPPIPNPTLSPSLPQRHTTQTPKLTSLPVLPPRRFPPDGRRHRRRGSHGRERPPFVPASPRRRAHRDPPPRGRRPEGEDRQRAAQQHARGGRRRLEQHHAAAVHGREPRPQGRSRGCAGAELGVYSERCCAAQYVFLPSLFQSSAFVFGGDWRGVV